MYMTMPLPKHDLFAGSQNTVLTNQHKMSVISPGNVVVSRNDKININNQSVINKNKSAIMVMPPPKVNCTDLPILIKNPQQQSFSQQNHIQQSMMQPQSLGQNLIFYT
jgi:hypothetical protein